MVSIKKRTEVGQSAVDGIDQGKKKTGKAKVEFRAVHVPNSIAFFQSQNLNSAGRNSGEKRAVKPRFYTEGTNITGYTFSDKQPGNWLQTKVADFSYSDLFCVRALYTGRLPRG